MDLNNLITTTTTSTAALVAIIGGFLVSRVISISSEQNGIKRKIREINNDLIAKRDIITNIEKYLFEDDLNDFVTNKNINRMLSGESLEDIIEEDEYTFLSMQELEPYLRQLREIANELYGLIENTDEVYTKFSQFNKEFYDFVYPDRKEWYAMIFEEIYKLSQPQPTGMLSGFGSFISGNPNTDYRESKKEKERLENEITILDLQKNEQIKILDDYGQPKWIWSGLFVLIYASIVSIIYPSTLLPYPPNTYNDIQTKWLILSLFYSQLFALFIYLGFAMYKLTHSDNND